MRYLIFDLITKVFFKLLLIEVRIFLRLLSCIKINMPTKDSIKSEKEYEEFTDEQKEGIHSFYLNFENFKNHQQQIVTRKSSIQLFFQLCVMIHRLRSFPAREMVYTSDWNGFMVTRTDSFNLFLFFSKILSF